MSPWPLVFEECGFLGWYWNAVLMPQFYNVGHYVNGCCDILMGA